MRKSRACVCVYVWGVSSALPAMFMRSEKSRDEREIKQSGGKNLQKRGKGDNRKREDMKQTGQQKQSKATGMRND